MEGMGTTRMSSKGQVVIPQKVRNRVGLKAGTEFIVLGEGDIVVLKAVQKPSPGEYTRLRKRAKDQEGLFAMAKAVGMLTSLPRAWRHG